MDFDPAYKKFLVPITKLAKKSRGYASFIDEEDLTQEMLIHLWREYQNGKFQDKTDSYIIQSLWFCSKNYIRKKIGKRLFLSLDNPLDGEEITLKDSISDNSPTPTEILESKMFVQRMADSGLTKREEDVLNLCLEGCNLREIGKRLGISHVMVFKIRKKIQRKVCYEYKN
ncbi:MAG: sigma-70 family RNA polymerase sigma factor [Candidatus Omnitrophota bacterium]